MADDKKVSKGWKTAFIISAVMFVLSIATMILMQLLGSRIPSWSLDSVAGNVVKGKFGNEEFTYTLNATGENLVRGNKRYTLVVESVVTNGVPNGAAGQLYDRVTGEKIDGIKSIMQSV